MRKRLHVLLDGRLESGLGGEQLRGVAGDIQLLNALQSRVHLQQVVHLPTNESSSQDLL